MNNSLFIFFFAALIESLENNDCVRCRRLDRAWYRIAMSIVPEPTGVFVRARLFGKQIVEWFSYGAMLHYVGGCCKRSKGEGVRDRSRQRA